MTTVCLSLSTTSRSRASTSCPVWVSSAPVGSSANTTSGRVMSARAIATRCCWPPESCEGRSPRRLSSPTRAAISRTAERRGLRPSSRSGSAMFWATVSDGSRLKAWNTNPIRSRRRIVNPRSLRSARPVPPSATLPEVGRSSPAATFRNVLLPEPDGPMIAVKDPGDSAALNPVEGDDRCFAPAIDLADIAQDDRRSRGGSPGFHAGGVGHEANVRPDRQALHRRTACGCWRAGSRLDILIVILTVESVVEVALWHHDQYQSRPAWIAVPGDRTGRRAPARPPPLPVRRAGRGVAAGGSGLLRRRMARRDPGQYVRRREHCRVSARKRR